MMTQDIKHIYSRLKKQFAQVQIDTGALDTRLLICHALKITHEKFVLQGDRQLTEDDIRLIEDLAAQRVKGKPVSKLIGYKEFYGRNFITTPDTLDPRPDSETLIEAVLENLPEKAVILDLGTGTGCLLLTLLDEQPAAQGIGVDRSEAALQVAKENARKLEIEDRAVFVQSDWFSAVQGMFDVIISNPPYIPAGEIAGLAPEVRLYDPMGALDGGADGLDPYRLIIPQLGHFLKPGGMVAFEIGKGQDSAVVAMLNQAGFDSVETRADLAGISRVVMGFKLQLPVDPV